jgi:hypothetical protein
MITPHRSMLFSEAYQGKVGVPQAMCEHHRRWCSQNCNVDSLPQERLIPTLRSGIIPKDLPVFDSPTLGLPGENRRETIK